MNDVILDRKKGFEWLGEWMEVCGLCGVLFVVGLVMTVGGFGGKIVLRLPFVEYVGGIGAFVMVGGIICWFPGLLLKCVGCG